ncbi:MAG: hypothetical protein ACLFWB_13220, partial [Armatimonadota bacterium]
EDVFADIPIESVSRAEKQMRENVREELPDICRRIEQGQDFTEEDRREILQVARMVVE